jgi:hypothetical protein
MGPRSLTGRYPVELANEMASVELWSPLEIDFIGAVTGPAASRRDRPAAQILNRPEGSLRQTRWKFAAVVLAGVPRRFALARLNPQEGGSPDLLRARDDQPVAPGRQRPLPVEPVPWDSPDLLRARNDQPVAPGRRPRPLPVEATPSLWEGDSPDLLRARNDQPVAPERQPPLPVAAAPSLW